MATQEEGSRSVEEWERQILILQSLQTKTSIQLHNARISLLLAQGKNPPVAPIATTSNSGTLECDPTGSETILALPSQMRDTRSDSQPASITLSHDLEAEVQPHRANTSSFLSLRLGKLGRYHALVEQQGWSIDNIESNQGPDCHDHPRIDNSARPDNTLPPHPPTRIDDTGTHYARTHSEPRIDNPDAQVQLTTAQNGQSTVFEHDIGPPQTPMANRRSMPSVPASPQHGSSAFIFTQYGQPCGAVSSPRPTTVQQTRPASSSSQKSQRTPVQRPMHIPPSTPMPMHQNYQQRHAVEHQRPQAFQPIVPQGNMATKQYQGPPSDTSDPAFQQNFWMQAAAAAQAQGIPVPQGLHMPPPNNVFNQHAAMRVRSQDTSSQHHNASPNLQTTDRPSNLLAGTGLSGRGLTRKSKQQSASSNVEIGIDQPMLSNLNSRDSLGKRSLSVELTEQRPRRRQRSESNRVTTPPLNTNHRRTRPNNEDDLKEEERSNTDLRDPYGRPVHTGTIDEYNAAPEPSQRQPTAHLDFNFEEQRTIHSRPVPQQSASRVNAPPPQGLTRQYLSNSSDEDEANSRRGRGRANTGTPALIAEARAQAQAQTPTDTRSNEEKDRNASRNRRPIREATRVIRQPGALRTPTYKTLSPTERTNLELQFCAQVARMITSKICMRDPPIPYDKRAIWQCFQERFRSREDQEFSKDQYRCATDFVTDTHKMLENYAAVAPCGPDCPFNRSGCNTKVMCYRVRMGAIVDVRMRNLQECLKQCECDFDGDDYEAKVKHVKAWFQKEDFEADRHWNGT